MYFGSRLSCGKSPRRLDPWLCDIGFRRLCLFLYIRPFLRPHRNKNSYIVLYKNSIALHGRHFKEFRLFSCQNRQKTQTICRIRSAFAANIPVKQVEMGYWCETLCSCKAAKRTHRCASDGQKKTRRFLDGSIVQIRCSAASMLTESIFLDA